MYRSQLNYCESNLTLVSDLVRKMFSLDWKRTVSSFLDEADSSPIFPSDILIYTVHTELHSLVR
jgi:hypothetical protein